MSQPEAAKVDVSPTEEALDAAYGRKRKKCGANVAGLIHAVRTALGLDSSATPSAARTLGTGSFNKAFLIQFGSMTAVARVPLSDIPAARDPIRLKSQVATLDYLRLNLPSVPVPRILAAAFSGDNPAGVPYIISELAIGTPIAMEEWYKMSDAARGALLDMLAHHWVRITAPISLDAIGSIMHNSTSPQLWRTAEAVSRGFRIIQLIPQYPRPYTECLHPSMELRAGPRSISEHWRYLIELQRKEIALYYPQSDPSVIVEDGLQNTHTLGELIQCTDSMERLADIAASLDPLKGRPAMALIHIDFACWRNVLLSEDRQRVRGIVDWDDAVVLPRDLAALYPNELTLEADCRPDP